MVLSQPFDIVSTQMLVNGAQLSFKVRNKSSHNFFYLCAGHLKYVICCSGFLNVFAKMQRHLYLLNYTIPSQSAAPPSVTFSLDMFIITIVTETLPSPKSTYLPFLASFILLLKKNLYEEAVVLLEQLHVVYSKKLAYFYSLSKFRMD